MLSFTLKTPPKYFQAQNIQDDLWLWSGPQSYHHNNLTLENHSRTALLIHHLNGLLSYTVCSVVHKQRITVGNLPYCQLFPYIITTDERRY